MSLKIKSKCVVLCRSKEDVVIVCKKFKSQIPFAEFICFSVASYIEAKKLGLKAIAVKEYCEIGTQTFAKSSVDLTREWLTTVLGDYCYSREDIVNSLIYPMHIFFSYDSVLQEAQFLK